MKYVKNLAPKILWPLKSQFTDFNKQISNRRLNL